MARSEPGLPESGEEVFLVLLSVLDFRETRLELRHLQLSVGRTVRHLQLSLGQTVIQRCKVLFLVEHLGSYTFYLITEGRNSSIWKRERKRALLGCKLQEDLKAAAPMALWGADDQGNPSEMSQACANVVNDAVNSNKFGAKDVWKEAERSRNGLSSIVLFPIEDRKSETLCNKGPSLGRFYKISPPPFKETFAASQLPGQVRNARLPASPLDHLNVQTSSCSTRQELAFLAWPSQRS